MRFVVAGEGHVAFKVIDALIADRRAEITGIFTSLSNPGRVKTLAATRQIPIFFFFELDKNNGQTHGVNHLTAAAPDYLINANSTILFKNNILEVPRRGALNLHPGPLPEYAGLHVHQWAIRNGESNFGVTIHFMEESVDTGDIVAKHYFPISTSDTGLSLFSRCVSEGAKLLTDVLSAILSDEPIRREKQDLSKRRLYRHRDALDGRINWKMSAQQVVNFVRAGNYEPFTSPSYTSHLDRTLSFPQPPQIFQVQVGPTTDAPPGTVVGFKDSNPIVACGANSTVAITRSKLGEIVVDLTTWKQYLDSLPNKLLLVGKQDDTLSG